MKFNPILFLCSVLFFTNSIAQKDTLKLETNVVLNIVPSKTDPRITNANTAHYVTYNPSIKQGKLLVFLPGTGGIASKGPKDFFSVAVNQGYRVLNISYINDVAVAKICSGQTLGENSKCTEEFREKRIFGNSSFSLIEDQNQDAIVNRLVKLLLYLSENDKDGNWGFYLENEAPKWNEIAVSGQSQGGGMAAFIAKRHLVARVIDFSGGWDYAAKDKIADWYSNKSSTPMNLWFGTYHTQEPTAKTIYETYQALKIPEDHIYAFNFAVPEGKTAHSDGVRNLAYIEQWIEMLGKGN